MYNLFFGLTFLLDIINFFTSAIVINRVSVTYNVIGRAITQFLFLTTQTSI